MNPEENPASEPKVIQPPVTRRDFMVRGAVAAAGTLIAGHAAAQEPTPSPLDANAASPKPSPASGEGASATGFESYSRYQPSFGGPVDADHYLGKLTPGLRAPGLEPVPVTCPDLEKLPWKMVNGTKEFQLRCEKVSREFLPGSFMNVWGFNGSMPGPTIEVFQGDRVRIVVHNDLPEPTSVHWHGLELPNQYDGVPGYTQDLIPAGDQYIYEFDLHQTGTFFYHTHVAMQEAFGMVGLFIIHPRIAYEPTIDRDFALVFQNFYIPPNSDTADSQHMGWNWHTINGRSGPYTTPLVCKLGERVRIRLLDFSPMQHHPIHLHGHTFWLTGTEGGRIPSAAWTPRNTTLVGVAMVQEFEFIAFNPGDWIFHCHMVHHMMNHMVEQVGPRIRQGASVDKYLNALPNRPSVEFPHTAPGFKVEGYPQGMQGMLMNEKLMMKLNAKREVKGMRHNWQIGPHGLMTGVRVLPEELYARVMESDEDIRPGEISEAIRKGDYRRPDQKA